MRLKAPEVGHVFRKCLVCGKTFRVWRSQLTYRAGDFCTQKCHRIARKLFRKMLREGLLEPLLQQMIAEERKMAA
jgi:hypothetical protein